MKKVFAVAMTLVMLVSVLTVSAGAVAPNYADQKPDQEVEVTWDGALTTDNTAHGGGKQENDGDTTGTTIGSHEVTVNVKDSNKSGTVHVYAVTFDTSELTFTWVSSAQLIWNPETLQYDNTGGTDEGQWDGSTLTGESSTVSQDITVYNYSDVAINVTAQAAQSSDDTVTVSVDGSLALDPAYTGAQTGTVQSGTLAVTVTGKPTGTYATARSISTITLTVTRNTAADPDTP